MGGSPGVWVQARLSSQRKPGSGESISYGSLSLLQDIHPELLLRVPETPSKTPHPLSAGSLHLSSSLGLSGTNVIMPLTLAMLGRLWSSPVEAVCAHTSHTSAASFFLRYVLLGACAWPGGGLSGALGLWAWRPTGLSGEGCGLPAVQPSGAGFSGPPGALCQLHVQRPLARHGVQPRAGFPAVSTPPSWVVSGRLRLVSGALCLGFLIYQVALPGRRRELTARGPQPRPVDIPRWSWAGAGGRGWVAWTGSRGRQASRQRPEGASLGHWGGWREPGRVSWGGLLLPGGPQHIASLVVPLGAKRPLRLGVLGHGGGYES